MCVGWREAALMAVQPRKHSWARPSGRWRLQPDCRQPTRIGTRTRPWLPMHQPKRLRQGKTQLLFSYASIYALLSRSPIRSLRLTGPARDGDASAFLRTTQARRRSINRPSPSSAPQHKTSLTSVLHSHRSSSLRRLQSTEWRPLPHPPRPRRSRPSGTSPRAQSRAQPAYSFSSH